MWLSMYLWVFPRVLLLGAYIAGATLSQVKAWLRCASRCRDFGAGRHMNSRLGWAARTTS
jgi:hypothetical protein